jgi:hypothetical protein
MSRTGAERRRSRVPHGLRDRHRWALLPRAIRGVVPIAAGAPLARLRLITAQSRAGARSWPSQERLHLAVANRRLRHVRPATKQTSTPRVNSSPGSRCRTTAGRRIEPTRSRIAPSGESPSPRSRQPAVAASLRPRIVKRTSNDRKKPSALMSMRMIPAGRSEWLRPASDSDRVAPDALISERLLESIGEPRSVRETPAVSRGHLLGLARRYRRGSSVVSGAEELSLAGECSLHFVGEPRVLVGARGAERLDHAALGLGVLVLAHLDLALEAADW